MSYIDNIRAAEERASEMVAKAERKSDETIAEATRAAEADLEALRAECAQSTQEAINAQKQELAKRYREITQKGGGDAEELRSGALLHKKEAVKFIINELTRN